MWTKDWPCERAGKKHVGFDPLKYIWTTQRKQWLFSFANPVAIFCSAERRERLARPSAEAGEVVSVDHGRELNMLSWFIRPWTRAFGGYTPIIYIYMYTLHIIYIYIYIRDHKPTNITGGYHPVGYLEWDKAWLAAPSLIFSRRSWTTSLYTKVVQFRNLTPSCMMKNPT